MPSTMCLITANGKNHQTNGDSKNMNGHSQSNGHSVSTRHSTSNGHSVSTLNNNHLNEEWKFLQHDSPPTAKEIEQEEKEFSLSRDMKWFTVRFFKRRTLSGDRTRYIFVDESQYGLVATNVAFFVIAHLFYLISLSITLKYTDGWIYAYCFGMFTSLGISPGVHRLWSHRCYSARLPLRIFLSICFTAVGQNDIYTWCRDHRLHHKFTETDADPHNSRRGAFFAHVGWLLTKKHPDVLIKGKTIDNSDLLKDPVVYWNRKLYILKYLLFRVYMPGLIPYYVFKVPLYLVAMGTYAQYVANLHATWFVNSAAHIFGDRPYNHKIQPRENFAVALFGYNEGFHNYHHQFPWDWRIAEHGIQWFDPGKWFIQLMYMVGLAYNLKEASPKLIQDTKERVRRETVKNLDAGFYVHDHPYFIPHQFTDDDVGSTINKEATEVSAEAAMTRPSTFSPSSSMTDINNNLIECQG